MQACKTLGEHLGASPVVTKRGGVCFRRLSLKLLDPYSIRLPKQICFFFSQTFFHPVMAATVYHRTYQSGAQVLPELNEIVLIPHSLC